MLVSSVSAEPRYFAHRPALVLDARFHRGHYHPAIGTVVPVLPVGHRPHYWHGSPFFFIDGVWYAPAADGYIVTRPPIGMVVTVLPPFATPIWVDGIPYYYADDVYYRYIAAQNAYEVVEAPTGAGVTAPTAQSSADVLYIYPKAGQSPQQQAADRYECHKWASGQTGFDPSVNVGADPPRPSNIAKR